VKRISTFLLWAAVAFGQSIPIPPADRKVSDQDFGLGVGAKGHPAGSLDILSDTQGVDFGPYLKTHLTHNPTELVPSDSRI